MFSPNLSELVQLFYSSVDELGKFAIVSPQDMPPVYRMLLDHHHHMTVTVEQHHRSPVNVQVLAVHESEHEYARKIVLIGQSDQRVVQFGIVRLRWDALSDNVAQQIKAAQIPLGRILIEHNVMRDVSLGGLWHVEPASELKRLFGFSDTRCETFGRTAVIRVQGSPAVELLEVVAPLRESLPGTQKPDTQKPDTQKPSAGTQR